MTSAKKRENSKRWHIRKNLPYQVALPNDLCCMENYAACHGEVAKRQKRGFPALLLCDTGRCRLPRFFREYGR